MNVPCDRDDRHRAVSRFANLVTIGRNNQLLHSFCAFYRELKNQFSPVCVLVVLLGFYYSGRMSFLYGETMRIKLFASSLMMIVLASVPLWGAPANASSSFTISAASHVPGLTLEPGSYTIHVVNRLSDRVILEVDAANGGPRAIFIGVPNSRIERPSASGPVRWPSPADGASYLKGWYFPGTSSVVEFVYPKAEAVAIAKSNPAKVPAVDPASEGKVADNTLSQRDMQLLTLWVLSLNHVGPADGPSAIKAERYDTASVSQRPAIKALPHTASEVPWVWLAGLCSLVAAGMVRLILWRSRFATEMAALSQRE
jgi:hypothetical protein